MHFRCTNDKFFYSYYRCRLAIWCNKSFLQWAGWPVAQPRVEKQWYSMKKCKKIWENLWFCLILQQGTRGEELHIPYISWAYVSPGLPHIGTFDFIFQCDNGVSCINDDLQVASLCDSTPSADKKNVDIGWFCKNLDSVTTFSKFFLQHLCMTKQILLAGMRPEVNSCPSNQIQPDLHTYTVYCRATTSWIGTLALGVKSWSAELSNMNIILRDTGLVWSYVGISNKNPIHIPIEY